MVGLLGPASRREELDPLRLQAEQRVVKRTLYKVSCIDVGEVILRLRTVSRPARAAAHMPQSRCSASHEVA
jgi:hypothetical protein